MENEIKKLRQEWAEGDAKRDAGLTVPEDIDIFADLRYGIHPENLLDIYRPKGTAVSLPTIISIHGGGWFYGSKKLYSHYCMRLAQRGFAVVNFDYRLAPEHKYPAPLEDTCQVLRWLCANAREYRVDLNNVFMVGDSAGGQIAFQILTMLTSKEYTSLFSFAPPEGFQIRGCGLNCGCYFVPLSRMISPKMMGPLFQAYFPETYLPVVPQLKAQKYIGAEFPPAFVMSAEHDYLKFMAAPLHRLLKRKGVETVLRIYGSKAQKQIGHVFHLDCRSETAAQCNDDQCAFFRSLIR